MKHNSYILHMDDGSDYIMHYGRKGMKWGQHVYSEDDMAASLNDWRKKYKNIDSNIYVDAKGNVTNSKPYDKFVKKQDRYITNMLKKSGKYSKNKGVLNERKNDILLRANYPDPKKRDEALNRWIDSAAKNLRHEWDKGNNIRESDAAAKYPFLNSSQMYTDAVEYRALNPDKIGKSEPFYDWPKDKQY